MSDTEDPARSDAVAAAGSGPAARIAALIADSAHVTAVFGAPVERDGVTVIPVARAAYGFGGGSGGDGEGGGGGVAATPVGWIEIRGGESRFRSLRPTAATLAVAVALGALAGAVAGRRR